MALRDQIIGNKTLLASLQGRAQTARLASLMIFAGPSGIGKKQVALSLSQELICPHGPPACGVCGPCMRIRDQKSESVLIVEPETPTAQIKLEQARQIEQFVQLRQLGKARAIIMDQAHRLNPQSSNALLKLFEEPPANTYIFLVTANPNSLLATIRSRAQLYRFAPLADEQMKTLTGADDWAIKMARGQIDLVYRLKENSKAWTDSKKQAVNFISSALGDNGDLFSKIKEIAGDRDASLQNILVWQSLFRDALVAGLGSKGSLLNSDSDIGELKNVDSENLSRMSSYLIEMEQDLGANVDRTLMLENFYFKMIALKSERV